MRHSLLKAMGCSRHLLMCPNHRARPVLDRLLQGERELKRVGLPVMADLLPVLMSAADSQEQLAAGGPLRTPWESPLSKEEALALLGRTEFLVWGLPPRGGLC